MGDDAPGRSEHGFRRPRRKISRRRQGVRPGAERSTCAAPARKPQGLPVHSRLQHDVRGGSLPAGPAHSRRESPRRPGAVHLGVARKAHGLCLRPQQRDRGARRPRAHAPSAARQQRGRGQRARPLDGQLGHGRSVPADQDFGRPQSRGTRSATCFWPRPISTSTCSSRKCAASASRASRSISSCPRTIGRCFSRGASPAASRESATTPMSPSLPRWARRSST